MKFLPFKLLLVTTNFTILGFLLLLIIKHCKSENNITSWSSIFHLLCSIWLLLRGIFWLSTITTVGSDWTAFSFYMLYWMPTPLHFAAFMILPLYFAQVIYPLEWKFYWKTLRPLYVVIIVSLTVFQIVWALLSALEKVIITIFCFVIDCFQCTN